MSHRVGFTAAAVAILLVSGGSPLGAQDWAGAAYLNRDAAEAWAFHDIALFQARRGETQEAKKTALQITDRGTPGVSNVTAVCFFNGIAYYRPLAAPCDALTGSPAGSAPRDMQCSYAAATPSVPTRVPSGLPANCLDADPRHGALVDFTDQYDSAGKRITGRRYADGYAVIETVGGK